MLSQTTEYALRAIVLLASEHDSAMTAQQVADGTKVPVRYMSKILQSLGREGLVNSQRGLHGGFTLARAPDELTILDVVDAIDPVRRIEHCPLGLPSHQKLCPLHRRLDEAFRDIQQAFGKTTIADVLSEDAASKPLCDVETDSGRVDVSVSRPKKRID